VIIATAKSNFRIDYGYSNYGMLGSVNHFGVMLDY